MTTNVFSCLFLVKQNVIQFFNRIKNVLSSLNLFLFIFFFFSFGLLNFHFTVARKCWSSFATTWTLWWNVYSLVSSFSSFCRSKLWKLVIFLSFSFQIRNIVMPSSTPSQLISFINFTRFCFINLKRVSKKKKRKN